jgi:hypothetical protein
MLKVSEQQEPVIRRTSKTNSHSLSDLPMRMNYCRKIFGTHLRYSGIESEMVNLLEGRISPEIFVRHYWSPNMKQDIGRVRKAIDSLAYQLV